MCIRDRYDRVYRIDMLREVKIVRELGKVSVKDSLFKDNNSYKEMAYIPIKGAEDQKFTITADII